MDCWNRQGVSRSQSRFSSFQGARCVNNIIYLVGLVVIVLVILGFFGLR